MDILMQALVQGLLVGSTYGIVALGLGLIFSVSGVVNFAHGDFLAVALFLSSSLFAAFALDPYVSVFITLPVLLAAGALLYRLLIRPVIGGHMLMVIQLTLGLSLMLQNGLLMIYGGQPLRVPSIMETKLLIVGNVVMRWPLIVAFLVSLVLAALLFVMLARTDFGRSIRAVHQNAKAAALMGIDVARVRTQVFALGVGLLAIAGALIVPGTPLSPGMGLRYTVITLLVLVLGGMSNFAGILAGGVVIGLAEAIGTIYVTGILGMILPYLVFVVILLFRPAGLLGRAA
ncbi:branched-chain amino acid ABC transporter permease [Chelatococcus reniformis]|uniref:Branched-chain amino acid ABC transporter permease n=1 Tax=Chelatococcus reniformis TaxID=1494448 RepID=A0A916UR49_9HYPH|nr:branched-chain amino acid ABC transporter permease [Chelatococcus reniformis]GGC83182.1 branched-chain amino acid ABC transporter permease [Chelatococcus reniformis]